MPSPHASHPLVRYAFAIASFLAGSLAQGEVSCPAIFGDHMVLQRARPIAVWGHAAPSEAVTVEFAGQTAHTTAATDGNWRVNLSPLKASTEPRTLIIRGTNTLTFSDVLVGEVWLCSGQSNMEKQLGARKGQKPTDEHEAAIAAANHPRLRFFQMPRYGKPQTGVQGLSWETCTSASVVATQMSATGYYFAKELLGQLDVPIGLIHSSYGGTRIEAWIPKSAFERPELKSLPGGPYDAWVKGVQATQLYDSMIAPLAPFTLRGFLWYQGESNLMEGETSTYTLKMQALIEAWRAQFAAPEAPFYYVLIAPHTYSHRTKAKVVLTSEALPLFWQSQIAAASLPHTAFISTTDITADVKDIHPTNKRDVGLRLARIALADTYQVKNAPLARSPAFASMKTKRDGSIELRFTHTGGALHTRDAQPPSTFLIAGEDQKFLPASAVIKGDKLLLSNPAITRPVAVRCGWDETTNPNLVNTVGLPVLPFRTDTWPVALISTPAPTPTP